LPLPNKGAGCIATMQQALANRSGRDVGNLGITWRLGLLSLCRAADRSKLCHGSMFNEWRRRGPPLQPVPERHEFFGYIKGLVAILRAPFRPFLLA